MTGYETYSTERLARSYIWEKDRVCKDDMRITQQAIKRELKARFNRFLRLLDDPEATEDADAKAALNRFLENGAKRDDKTVTMSADDWNTLSCYILMTTRYREGERAAWETLAGEKDEAGNPKFKNAASNAAYFAELDGKLRRIRDAIEKVY